MTDRHVFGRRLQALILTLIFLGGGTSLPSTDVLLYHLHGEMSQATAHVETTNGCASHAGHCGVSCPASAASALGAREVAVPLEIAVAAIAPRPFGDVPAPSIHSCGFHSRAPPTFLS
jgi:hypothetical protein